MYVAPPSTYDWRANRYNGDTRRENPTANSYQYNREQGYVRGRSNTDAIDNTADKRYTTPTTTRNGFIDATPDKRYSPPTNGPDQNGFVDTSTDKRYSAPKPPEPVNEQQPVTTNAHKPAAEKTAAEKSAEEEKIPTTGPPRTATRKVKDNKKRDDNSRQ
jgi:hypothetical protein